MFYVSYYDVERPKKRYAVSTTLPDPSVKGVNADVMLVQYYLARIFAKTGGAPDKGPLIIDGRWGPRTARWVLAYQKMHRLKGDLIATDGRVSPAFDPASPPDVKRPFGLPNEHSGMAPRGLWYTTVWMGWDYFDATGQEDVADDPLAPTTLKAFAKGARGAAGPEPISL